MRLTSARPGTRVGRRGSAALLGMALLSGAVLALPGTAAHAADTLISQGRTVTASSVENGGTPAAYAVDGDTGTRWSSAATDQQWIQVDLGQSASISKVVLQWEAAYGKAYQIQTSADGVAWTTVYSTTTGAGGTETLNVTGSGRYVRMNGVARATGYGYSLWEFQVFGSFTGSTPSCGTTNAAQGGTATASSTENAGTPASAAVDGNTGTRWSSAAADPQWLQVDLGSVQQLCQVTLNWEAAYGKAYQIQSSNDGTTWTTLYSTTTGAGGNETLNVAGSGRYVRLYGTQRGTGYGYSLWEFGVHTGGGSGTPSPSPPPPPPFRRCRAAATSARTCWSSTRRRPTSRPPWTRSSPSRSRTSSAPTGTRCCSSPARTTTSTPRSASTPRSRAWA
ncbi:hypothetical protein GCM10025734_24540 [Kitasatospora paranensis]